MANSLIAVMFIIVLQTFMVLTNAAILDINPENDLNTFYDCENSLLGTFGKEGCNTGGNNTLSSEYALGNLPTAETSTTSTSGVFTDTFSSIARWINNVPILGPVIMSPYNVLQRMNLPSIFVFSIGGMWYIISFFIFVGFFWGKE